MNPIIVKTLFGTWKSGMILLAKCIEYFWILIDTSSRTFNKEEITKISKDHLRWRLWPMRLGSRISRMWIEFSSVHEITGPVSHDDCSGSVLSIQGRITIRFSVVIDCDVWNELANYLCCWFCTGSSTIIQYMLLIVFFTVAQPNCWSQ